MNPSADGPRREFERWRPLTGRFVDPKAFALLQLATVLALVLLEQSLGVGERDPPVRDQLPVQQGASIVVRHLRRVAGRDGDARVAGDVDDAVAVLEVLLGELDVVLEQRDEMRLRASRVNERWRATARATGLSQAAWRMARTKILFCMST